MNTTFDWLEADDRETFRRSLGMMRSSNQPEDMTRLPPWTELAQSRWFVHRADSGKFPKSTHSAKVTLRRQSSLAVVSQKSHFNSSAEKTPN
jgi:hypothetical protein